MQKLTSVQPLPGYRLRLEYADGVVGELDLSSWVGQGVFAIWNDPEVFRQVEIGPSGEVRWNDQVDMCADALYLEITGKSPADLFPSLARSSIHA